MNDIKSEQLALKIKFSAVSAMAYPWNVELMENQGFSKQDRTAEP
jgi:hypothetical protein